MDSELKAKWVEALRSGKYEQTRGTLFDGDGYCCLGVLCKVAEIPIRHDGGGVAGHGSEPNSHSSYQPIFDLLGGYEHSLPLSMRNDGGDFGDQKFDTHSFPEIADYIEKNL